MIFGVLMFLVGFALSVSPQVPWLGKLPGDIRIERPGFRLHVPIVTCLLLSVVASALLGLFSRGR